jgi:site-specific DNA recombinase
MATSKTKELYALENQNPRETEKTGAPEKQTPTRCAIYTRVSTDQQTEGEFNSCEAQEDRIRSFIASQEGFTVAKVYIDPGYTGANIDRPGLRQLLADVQAGLLDMVVTYKIDRLTRSPRDFYQLIEHFEANKVGYISVTERFDTSTPSGRLLRNIMLTFAQFERELTSERIKDKVIQRVGRGLHTGGRPPHGYKSDRGMLALDPPRDAQVRLIFESYVQTRSIRAVIRTLKSKGIVTRKGTPFYDSAIWHMLRNPIYSGKIVHNGKTHPGRHPAIISEDLFVHVQKLIEEAPRLPPNPENHLPFAGLIKCKECGSVMSVAFTHKKTGRGVRKYFYYRCNSVGHNGRTACSTKQIGADRLHDMVYRNLLRISVDGEYLKNLVFSLQNQTNREPERGFEPLQDFNRLTPENLQKDLKAYVKTCARKTGIEKVLAVRGGIRRVHYSKKSVRVDYVVGACEGADLERGPVSPGGRCSDFSDGQTPTGPVSLASARSAANGAFFSESNGKMRKEGAFGWGVSVSTPPTKKPNRMDAIGLSGPGGRF